jgi:hypothetical protein
MTAFLFIPSAEAASGSTGPIVQTISNSGTIADTTDVLQVTTTGHANVDATLPTLGTIGDLGGYFGLSVAASGICIGIWHGAAKQTARIAIVDGVNYLVDAYFDAGTLSCQVGAGAPATVATGGNIDDLSNTMILGRDSFGPAFDGPLASLAIYNAKLSAPDEAQARAFFHQKYGVVV